MTPKNGSSPKFRFIWAGHILLQQHTAALSATRHPKIWMAAESRKSPQVFSRDIHRTLSFQHEAFKLVHPWLPSPKPTSLQKGSQTKTRLSFLKNKTSNKVHPTELCCLHLLSGWSHKCQKKGKHSIIDNLCRNNYLTNYHNCLNFSKIRAFFSVRCWKSLEGSTCTLHQSRSTCDITNEV